MNYWYPWYIPTVYLMVNYLKVAFLGRYRPTGSIMTSLHGNAFCIAGPLWWKPRVTHGFRSQRQVLRGFDVFSVVSQNKLLNKQANCLWFETPGRRCNVTAMLSEYDEKPIVWETTHLNYSGCQCLMTVARYTIEPLLARCSFSPKYSQKMPHIFIWNIFCGFIESVAHQVHSHRIHSPTPHCLVICGIVL